ncbi:unannotated protein [freshwater metagenome]|uniref:Unannotated protein n=1 Tax=freshwater metagenome TaxID=449393 RepID=A0A6J7BQD5_9ZZZZ|nr:hypothetical protein [Actinomycetota bacterium]MSX37955.1 hypothetical protein [Actinomycetota bacterium]
MSKAIYGQISGSEALLLSEVTRLRRRVRDLEDQVAAYEADVIILGQRPSLVSGGRVALDEALRGLGESEPALL